MSSKTSRKDSSDPPGTPEVGQPALNWLVQDLLELEFGLSSEDRVRWTVTGFSCGLRLATLESTRARKLLRECVKGEKDNLLTEIVLPQVARRPLTVTDELSKLRGVFTSVLMDPPKEIRSEVTGLDRKQQLAWWFRHSVTWGMQAGLNADSLFTGRMLAFLDKLPLNQRFICDRLVHILRAGERRRRPALIEFFDYTYPSRPLERATIIEAALKVLDESTRWGKPLDAGNWILCGFREGLLISTQNARRRRKVFSESTQEGMEAVWALFAKHVGPDPAGWNPKHLVGEALAWLRKVHPTVVKPNCRAVEFERIRHLFDFAFWMGLAAGASDGSTR